MNKQGGFLRHFKDCNRYDATKFVSFSIGGKQYGWIAKDLAALLPSEMDFFVPAQDGIALAPQLDNFRARSEALDSAATWLASRFNRVLRKEMYPIIEQLGDAPLAQLDRTAVPWFGIKAWGEHVNGYVHKKDGLYLWIGERAMDRIVDPGKLDNLIAGGQPIGISVEDNLVKEAAEEAGIGAELARTSKQVGQIGYKVERMNGLRNDVLLMFDLELPEDFKPRNTDGEVASFQLMPVEEVAEIVRTTDRFKFNCNLVITDFLIRHGYISPDHPEYAEIMGYLAK